MVQLYRALFLEQVFNNTLGFFFSDYSCTKDENKCHFENVSLPEIDKQTKPGICIRAVLRGRMNLYASA